MHNRNLSLNNFPKFRQMLKTKFLKYLKFNNFFKFEKFEKILFFIFIKTFSRKIIRLFGENFSQYVLFQVTQFFAFHIVPILSFQMGSFQHQF